MKASTHISFGLLTSLIEYKTTGNINTGWIVLGSLLTDIDSQHSIISQCCPLISLPIKKIQKHTVFLDHRHLTHCIWPALSLFLFYNQILWGILLGHLSHLFADLFNARGVMLLFPIPIKFRIARITTGSIWEIRINWLVWIIMTGVLTYPLWINHIQNLINNLLY